MNLSHVQKLMLREMLTWGDYCYGYFKFEIRRNDGKGYLQKEELKKEMKPLLDNGLVKCIRGLINDDGEVCGSGFEIVYSRKKEIDEMVKTTIHELKIYPQYLDALKRGVKTFEIRYNDRNYQVGDILKFNDSQFEIIYIHAGLGLIDGYVCMSVRELY